MHYHEIAKSSFSSIKSLQRQIISFGMKIPLTEYIHVIFEKPQTHTNGRKS